MNTVRPIDGNALKESARKTSVFRTYDAGTPDLRALVDAASTLDYAPVVHAHWIEEGGLTWCSQCKEKPLYDYFGRSKLSNYCPNCGANMDGGKK